MSSFPFNKTKEEKKKEPSQKRELFYTNAELKPPFYIAGTIVEGDKRGRTLGFPTINLKLKNLSIPFGIYVVLAKVEDRILKGIAHVGYAKTFNSEEPRVEVHLLDFSGNLYNKRVELNLLKLLRQVKKFNSPADLITQLKADAVVAKHFLKNL